MTSLKEFNETITKEHNKILNDISITLKKEEIVPVKLKAISDFNNDMSLTEIKEALYRNKIDYMVYESLLYSKEFGESKKLQLIKIKYLLEKIYIKELAKFLEKDPNKIRDYFFIVTVSDYKKYSYSNPNNTISKNYRNLYRQLELDLNTEFKNHSKLELERLLSTELNVLNFDDINIKHLSIEDYFESLSNTDKSLLDIKKEYNKYILNETNELIKNESAKELEIRHKLINDIRDELYLFGFSRNKIIHIIKIIEADTLDVFNSNVKFYKISEYVHKLSQLIY